MPRLPSKETKEKEKKATTTTATTAKYLQPFELNLINNQFMGNLFKFIYFGIESFAFAAPFESSKNLLYLLLENINIDVI